MWPHLQDTHTHRQEEGVVCVCVCAQGVSLSSPHSCLCSSLLVPVTLQPDEDVKNLCKHQHWTLVELSCSGRPSSCTHTQTLCENQPLSLYRAEHRRFLMLLLLWLLV